MLRLLCLLVMAAIIAVPAYAANLNAPNCQLASVQGAVNSASNGDTVTIPSGSCTWDTQLTITKGISVIGAGIDQTVLTDNVPKDGSNVSRLISFNVSAPNNFRLSGFTVHGQSVDSAGWNKSHIAVAGSAKAFRIDHIKFEQLRTSPIVIDGDMWGVIDHNQFYKSYQNAIRVRHSNWGGSNFGDGSWADPLYLGTEKAVYIEGNYFEDTSFSQPGGIDDCENGGRMVIRYNTIKNDFMQAHGTDSGQRWRGCRSFEVYNNNIVSQTNFFTFAHMRSGTGVFFNNTFQQNPDYPACGFNCFKAGYSIFMSLQSIRDDRVSIPWGLCDGSSPYDQNTAGQSGYRCVDQIGSGTSRDLGGVDTPTAQWVGNINDPVYAWNNNFAGDTAPPMVPASSHIQSGRDFFNNTPRPGYKPYVYPHPLTSGTNPGSPCDINADGFTNVADVQLSVNQAIGTSPCSTADINRDGQCNVIDVQGLVNATLGGACVAQ